MADPIAIRAQSVANFLHRKESTVRIETIQDALRIADAWRWYAYRMETLHAIADGQWRSSETLRQIAEDELAKLRGKHG